MRLYTKRKACFYSGLLLCLLEKFRLVVSFILSRTVLVLIALQDYGTKHHNNCCLAEGEKTIVERGQNNPAAKVETCIFYLLLLASHGCNSPLPLRLLVL